MEQSLPKKRGRPKGSKNKPKGMKSNVDSLVVSRNISQARLLSEVRHYLREKGDYIHSNKAIHIIMGSKRPLVEIIADCKTQLKVDINLQ